MTHGVCVWDESLRLFVSNTRFLELFNLSPAQVRRGVHLRDVLRLSHSIGNYPNKTFEQVYDDYLTKLKTEGTFYLERDLPDGRTVAVYNRPKKNGCWVVTYEDVTERKAFVDRLREREAELETKNRLFDAAINNMAHGLSMFDRDERLIVCNQPYLDMYGLASSSIKVGMSFQDILWARVAAGTFTDDDPVSYVAFQLAEARRREVFSRIVRLRDGRILSIWHRPLEDGGWISTQQDITAQKAAEERATYLASHDALTGLPNRSLLSAGLARALSAMHDGDLIAILYLDLDRFKAVNDTLGHGIGDGLLQQVSERLVACVGDPNAVARLGGDEFAILQRAPDDPSRIPALANAIIASLGEPFNVAGHRILTSASLGIAIAPNDGRETEQLLRNADLALYRAKGNRGSFCRFEQSMDSKLQARLSLEIDLAQALERNEFEIVYQPIVGLPSGAVCGYEALLRWRHATRGLVPPEEFIPIAEESGLIQEIGTWVLQRACAEAASWDKSFRLAVNLSAVQLRSRTLALTVAAALAQSGLAPSRLDLEITESVLLNDNEGNLRTLQELHDLGVGFSLDDFGTGYSSLSYLQRFPFDSLKIDRSFIDQVTSRADRAAIVRAILGLGRSLNMSVIAEGVETQDQLAWLSAEGCPEAQGYLFARPLTCDELSSSITPQYVTRP